MTILLLVAAGVPLMQRLFPPQPLIEQVHRTPMLIFGVLQLCLASAFLATRWSDSKRAALRLHCHAVSESALKPAARENRHRNRGARVEHRAGFPE